MKFPFSAKLLFSYITHPLIAIILGFAIRFLPISFVNFPLNDGALFYTMTEEVQQAQYILPYYTSYNQAEIPFAYPPLSFYLAALLSHITALPLIDFFRILPLVISTLTIPVVYLISRFFISSKTACFFAALSFAVLPKSYEWLIMGGGLTRSLGFLFALLATYAALRFFTSRSNKLFLLTSIFLTLTILSHPEMTLFAVLNLLLLAFRKKNRMKNIFAACGILMAGVVFSAPWWGVIIFRHGFTPFMAAASTGLWSVKGLLLFLELYIFAEGSLLTLVGVLGLFGFFYCLIRREIFIPLWLLVLFIVIPRSAETLATIPLAILSGVCFSLLLPYFSKSLSLNSKGKIARAQPHDYRGPLFLLIFLFTYFVMSNIMFQFSDESSLTSLSREDLKAMDWIRNHTVKTDRFLVLSEEQYYQWGISKRAEWFPAITKRQSMMTMQGSEWLPDNAFGTRYFANRELHPCKLADVTCLERWEKQTGLSFSHIYIHNNANSPQASHNPFAPIEHCCDPLILSLKQSPAYQLIYSEADTYIFARK